MTLILLTREIVKLHPQPVTEEVEYIGFWPVDQLEAAKEYVRQRAAKWFKARQMPEIVGEHGTLFIWHHPGVTPGYQQRYVFRPLEEAPLLPPSLVVRGLRLIGSPEPKP